MAESGMLWGVKAIGRRAACLWVVFAIGLAAQEPQVQVRRVTHAIMDTSLSPTVDGWWELHGCRFLVPPATRTPPDGTFVATRVRPALRQALDSDQGDLDLVACSLLALAQIARDVPDERLVDDVRRQLRHPMQEVRETAALALGIAGRDSKVELDLLVRLVRGDAALGPTEGEPPSLRTRTFATYGLGFVAANSPALATQRTAFTVLRGLLDAPAEVDLQVAAVHALGLLRLPAGEAAAEELRGAAVDLLAALWKARDEKPQDLVACTCPIAIGKLLRRDHARSAEFASRCLAELERRRDGKDSEPSIAQSCAIALGLLLRPDDEKGAQALCKTASSHPDGNVVFFASMALAEVGGSMARGALRELFGYQNEEYRRYARLFAVLSLGVAMRQTGITGAERAEVAKAIEAEFTSWRNPAVFELLPSLLLGAGLAGFDGVVAKVAAGVDQLSKRENLAVCYCEALQMLGRREGIAIVRKLYEQAGYKVDLRSAAANALLALGEQGLAAQLIKEALEAENLVITLCSLRAASTAATQEEIDTMVRALEDTKRPQLQRAFLAWAIGRAARRGTVPWWEQLTSHVNYVKMPQTLRNPRRDGVLDIVLDL